MDIHFLVDDRLDVCMLSGRVCLTLGSVANDFPEAADRASDHETA